MNIFIMFFTAIALFGRRRGLAPAAPWRAAFARTCCSNAAAIAYAFRIDWATWLRQAGIDGIDPKRGVRFDSATFAVEAAVHGEGVLLGRSALVSADLAAGRPVRPFDLALKSVASHYLVHPDGALRQKKARAFRDWLFAEVAADWFGMPKGD